MTAPLDIFEQGVRATLGVAWRIEADELSFAAAGADLLAAALDGLLIGARDVGDAIEGLQKLKLITHVRVLKEFGLRHLARERSTLIYTVGTEQDGSPSLYSGLEMSRPLLRALDGIIGEREAGKL